MDDDSAAEPLPLRPLDLGAYRTRHRRRQTYLVGASTLLVAAAIAAVVGVLRPTPAAILPPARATGTTHSPRVTAAQLTRFRWSALPPAPIAVRSDSASVWTGNQLIVWGGFRKNRKFADGAAYEPSTRTWRVLPPAPLTPRAAPFAVWTGSATVVWGGDGPGGRTNTGAVYIPSTRRWRVMPPAPGGYGNVTDFVADGSRAVRLTIDKTFAADKVNLTVFDPRTDCWHRLPTLHVAPKDNYTGATAAVVRGRLVVWVSADGSFTLHDGHWIRLAYAPASAGCIYQVVAAGDHVIFPASFDSVSCGGDLAYSPGARGSEVSLATGRTRRLSYTATSEGYPTVAWTGAALLNADAAMSAGFDGSRHTSSPAGASAAWNPATNRWLPVARAPGTDPVSTWVWTGTQLIGWGDFTPTHPGARHVAGLTLAAVSRHSRTVRSG